MLFILNSSTCGTVLSESPTLNFYQCPILDLTPACYTDSLIQFSFTEANLELSGWMNKHTPLSLPRAELCPHPWHRIGRQMSSYDLIDGIFRLCPSPATCRNTVVFVTWQGVIDGLGATGNKQA